MYRIILAVLIAMSGLFASAAYAADENRLDLRLIAKSALNGYTGCSYALWQRNRDPERDKFAYVFFIRFHDAHPMPALIKVGSKLIELNKVEIGVKDSNLSDKFQVYRDAKKTITALIEVEKERRDGDFTVIEQARLTFIQRGKFPFRMTVKGGFRCPKKKDTADTPQADEPVEETLSEAPKKPAQTRLQLPPNLDRNGVRLGRKQRFTSLRQVPRHVRKIVADNGEACNLKNVAGHGEKYAISDAMTLWVVPCDLFRANASFMLITALNGTKHAIGLEIPKRPGSGVGEPGYDLMSPIINPGKGVVSVLNMGRQGDCGTLEHYQLVVVEGEAVELKLLEVREKNDCNGVKVNPNRLPLVYRAR